MYCKHIGYTAYMETQPVAEARANLSEIVNQVRIARRSVVLTRRGTPQAAVVPTELASEAELAGGPDVAAEILRRGRENAG